MCYVIRARSDKVRSLGLSACALLLSACASGTFQSNETPCRIDDMTSAERPQKPNLDHLRGRFRVVVNLVVPPDPLVLHGDLFLRMPTSEELPPIARAPGRTDLQLIGGFTWHFSYRELPAELDAGILYFGCRFCYDGVPAEMSIAGSSTAGFWGSLLMHRPNLSDRMDPKTGRLRTDPDGTFCAVRF
jgi:hypothetical protein